MLKSGVSGNPYRIREPIATSLVEIWMVAGVVTILGIRGYLELTGYPQVGGGELHVAHMLWGGLGMVVGFGMLILFAHPVWKPPAALVSGAGFGCFIDELGKFITKDNDYFYQPTVALIYVIFVIFFLLTKVIVRRRKTTEADQLFLAAQGLQWLAIGKLDREHQRLALQHLEDSGNTSNVAVAMREMLEQAELIPYTEQSRLLAWRHKLDDIYWRLVSHHYIERIVIGIFVLRAVQIVGSLAVSVGNDFYDFDDMTFTEGGALFASSISGLFAVYGVYKMWRGDRLEALHAFAGSTLFSLLFGQFFAFAASQFAAFGNLVVDLIVLSVLRFAIAAETTEREDDSEQESEIGERKAV